MKRYFIYLAFASLLHACANDTALFPRVNIEYPHADRGQVVDDYFGTKVADPYRWMEDMHSYRTREWYRAENQLARQLLDGVSVRETMQARMQALWSYTTREAPIARGGRWFFKETAAGDEQASVYVARRNGSAPPRKLADARDFATDGRIAIDRIEPSPDGRFVAISLSDAGSDWRTWRIVNAADGTLLPDTVAWTKFTGVSWRPDGSGFYYSRHPLDEHGRGDGMRPAAIHFHALGTHAAEDPLVFALPGLAMADLYGDVSPDGKHLLVSVFSGYAENSVLVLPLEEHGQAARPLFADEKGFANYIGGTATHAYFITNAGAESGRVVRVRWNDPATVEAVVPPRKARLLDAALGGQRLFLHYLEDARSRLEVRHLESGDQAGIPLPGIGSVSELRATPQGDAYFTFSSFSRAPVIHHYDRARNATRPWFESGFAGRLAGIETEQVFVTSRDGTQVPMFIVRKKGAPADAPVILYGYGGFDYPLTPAFSVPVAAWLEMGGVYAVANLRGGGEYGRAWHLAGTRANKQNVFDDFIAAAEWLRTSGIAREDRLIARGTSNGGLLVGAVMTQRPDLFAAALPEVGVMDMLRYQHQHVEARQWQSDYGISEDAEAFEYLYAYSPYHNIREGNCYPPTLVTTAIHDDRVMSWHSFKFAAALQHAQACDNPVLIHTETRAGHGAYKSRSLLASYFADQFAFIARATGWRPAAPE